MRRELGYNVGERMCGRGHQQVNDWVKGDAARTGGDDARPTIATQGLA